MDALQAGITAAREGRRAEARELLQQALQANPRSERGWLWMSAVVETDDERRTCLERVLTVNPHNQTAQSALEKLHAASTLEDGMASYLPIPRSSPLRNGASNQLPADSGSLPPSLHSLPTLAMYPELPGSRPIRRLAPEPEAMDSLAALRAAQFQPPAAALQTAAQSDPFTALILIGGLSITALAGAILLGVLWLIGWPP